MHTRSTAGSMLAFAGGRIISQLCTPVYSRCMVSMIRDRYARDYMFCYSLHAGRGCCIFRNDKGTRPGSPPPVRVVFFPTCTPGRLTDGKHFGKGRSGAAAAGRIFLFMCTRSVVRPPLAGYCPVCKSALHAVGVADPPGRGRPPWVHSREKTG